MTNVVTFKSKKTVVDNIEIPPNITVFIGNIFNCIRGINFDGVFIKTKEYSYFTNREAVNGERFR